MKRNFGALPLQLSAPSAPRIGAYAPAWVTPLPNGDARAPAAGAGTYRLIHAAFLLFLLLVPPRNLYLYYVVTSLAILGFTLGVPKVLNRPAKLLIALTTFVLFGAFLRTIAFVEPNPRDYIEAARFVPLILVYSASGAWRRLRLESIVDAAFAYLMLDALASVLQFTQRDLFGFNALVMRLYSSEHHYESALLIARRALGLSPGPGPHSAVLFVLATVMLYAMFVLRRRLLISLLGFLIAIASLMLSQSQTGFAVTGAIAVGVLTFFLFRGPLRNRLLSGVLLVGIGAAVASLLVVIATQLRYLVSLFVYGLGRSSYLNRLEKWQELIGLTRERPWWFPVGWGKDYFGPISGAMDSDYVYMYCVYGALVVGAFAIIVFHFLATTLRQMLRGSVRGYRGLLFFLVLGGTVFAWPNAFFTTANVALVLVFIHIASCWMEESSRVVPMVPEGDLPPHGSFASLVHAR